MSADRLIDELWGEDPPARARDSLQVHVSRLRKGLAEAGADDARVSAADAHRYDISEDPVEARLEAEFFEPART